MTDWLIVSCWKIRKSKDWLRHKTSRHGKEKYPQTQFCKNCQFANLSTPVVFDFWLTSALSHIITVYRCRRLLITESIETRQRDLINCSLIDSITSKYQYENTIIFIGDSAWSNKAIFRICLPLQPLLFPFHRRVILLHAGLFTPEWMTHDRHRMKYWFN